MIWIGRLTSECSGASANNGVIVPGRGVAQLYRQGDTDFYPDNSKSGGERNVLNYTREGIRALTHVLLEEDKDGNLWVVGAADLPGLE